MEYICTICSTTLLSIGSYCLHVKRHKPIGEIQRSQQFNCPLCLQTPSYQRVSRLKKHLETCKDERLAAAQEDAPNDTSFNENPETDNLDDFERNTVCSEDRDSDIEMIEAGDGSHSSSREIFNHTLCFCLDWFSKMNSSLKVAEDIINSTKSLFEKYLSGIAENLKNCNSKEEIMQCFESSSFEVTKSLELLNTIQKVKTTARNRELFCEPSQFVVRNETVQVLGELEEKQETGALMTIKHEVKGFLEMPGVLKAIIDQQKKMLDSPFPNLVNGAIGQEILHEHEVDTVIFIGLYQDDFNPDNALGPQTSTTKLSAYYYNYPTLPDHMALKLDTIFLAAVHKSKDVSNEEVLRHGIDPAIYAIWNAFHPLEVDGLDLDINGSKRKVYLAIAQFCGDNLGLNTSFGFSRGFSGTYCCRICQINKIDMTTSVDVILDLLRQEGNFNECLEGTTTQTRKGVKYDSWLNKFRFFRVYKNYSVDIMHDVFLGVFKYGLTAVLRYYINRGAFTLDEFNRKKRLFEYGKKDKGNISVDITENHLKDNLRINAKEMWTLVEYLPLILSPLLTNPSRCRVFSFVLQMVDVLDHITRKQYTNEQITQMEASIRMHHRMYMDIFDQTLTIKFHLMLHYGHIVRLSGPLRYSMSFKFESKHQELKAYANNCQSRINLPWSICTKFSFNYALKKLENEGLRLDVSEVKAYSDKNLLWIPSHHSFQIVCSLRYKGVYFDIGDIVEKEGSFFTIRGIAHHNQTIMFYIETLVCQYIVNMKSYEVLSQSTGFLGEMSIHELTSNPVNMHKVGDKCYFRVKH